MASRLWGPGAVIIVFTLAGGLIGGDIALSPWITNVSIMSTMVAVTSGLVTGDVAGWFIVWFIRQIDGLS